MSFIQSNLADPALSINWKKLPVTPHPTFFESSKVRKITASIFAALAVVAAVGAIFTALYLKASPVAVIGGTVGLGILALACAVTSLSIFLLKPSYNDPGHRQHLREAAGQDLMAHREYGYETIRSKYPQPEILTFRDINALIHRDLSTLTYSQFIEKHGDAVLLDLTEENRELLKFLFLNENWRKPFSEISVKDRRNFNLSEDGFRDYLVEVSASRLMNADGTYSQFLERNGNNFKAFCLIKDPKTKSFFQKKFMAFALQSRLSFKEIKNQHEGAYNSLSNEDKRTLMYQIFEIELASVLAGELTYDLLRECNGIELIKLAEDEKKEALKQKFLLLPAYEITKPAYDADRTFFGITASGLEQSIRERWEQLPFDLLAKNDEFFRSLGTTFRPEDWKDRALRETSSMSVQYIAAQYPKLFSSKILTGKDARPNGRTIKESLTAEIEPIGSFEELRTLFSSSFEIGLLTKNDPKVAALVTRFVLDNGLYYVQGKVFPNDPSKDPADFIEKYSLMPLAVKRYVEECQRDYQQSYSRHISSNTEEGKKCVRELNDATVRKDARIKTAQGTARINEKQKLFNDIKAEFDRLSELTRSLEAKNERLGQLTKSNIEEECRRLRTQIGIVKRAELPNESFLKELTDKLATFLPQEAEILGLRRAILEIEKSLSLRELQEILPFNPASTQLHYTENLLKQATADLQEAQTTLIETVRAINSGFETFRQQRIAARMAKQQELMGILEVSNELLMAAFRQHTFQMT